MHQHSIDCCMLPCMQVRHGSKTLAMLACYILQHSANAYRQYWQCISATYCSQPWECATYIPFSHPRDACCVSSMHAEMSPDQFLRTCHPHPFCVICEQAKRGSLRDTDAVDLLAAVFKGVLDQTRVEPQVGGSGPVRLGSVGCDG